ncbi:hypothetical protein F8388_024197 [Cannabis sativa]|uniref:Uncharacterized protein n=1 Tax=Cannabis sativa TaxID=3483 RepID=A0A7J6DYN0_CANSA|nr:hypothetical protein F8388_024197 [Cannabis sativa]
MSASVASSYVLALADLAKSNNTLEATSADVEKIDKVFSDPSVFSFFMNPTIEEEKKRKMIDEIDLIIDVTKEFERVYNGMTETELAVVSAVVKLESQHLAQIAKTVQKLTGAKNIPIKLFPDCRGPI